MFSPINAVKEAFDLPRAVYAKALLDWYSEASKAQSSPWSHKAQIVKMLSHAPLSTSAIKRRLHNYYDDLEDYSEIDSILNQLAQEGKIIKRKTDNCIFWELNRPQGMKPITIWV